MSKIIKLKCVDPSSTLTLNKFYHGRLALKSNRYGENTYVYRVKNDERNEILVKTSRFIIIRSKEMYS